MKKEEDVRDENVLRMGKEVGRRGLYRHSWCFRASSDSGKDSVWLDSISDKPTRFLVQRVHGSS